jgi:hypothetical protein
MRQRRVTAGKSSVHRLRHQGQLCATNSVVKSAKAGLREQEARRTENTPRRAAPCCPSDAKWRAAVGE